MKKCLPLNLLKPTKTKKRLLRETYNSFHNIVGEALSYVDGVKSRGQLHRETYETFRGIHNAASQLIIEATSYAWTIGKRKRNRRTTATSRDVRRCVVRFDGRLFSFRGTRRGNPVSS